MSNFIIDSFRFISGPPTPDVHLKFNSDALDSSGNGHDFSTTNVTYDTTTQKTGSAAINYTAAPASLVDRANVSGLNVGTGEFAFAFWMKTTDNNKWFIDWQGATNANTSVTGTVTAGGKLRLQGGMGNVDSTTTVNDGNWHHCIIQRTASQVEVYVDGGTAEATSSATNWDENKSATGRHTLFNAANTTVPTIGTFDDFRAYIGKSLTASEISDIYNGGSGTEN